MRRQRVRTVDPSMAHQRLAREQYGAQTTREVADDLAAQMDGIRAAGAGLPRITGTTDHDILMSVVDALRRLGLVEDQTTGPDVAGL